MKLTNNDNKLMKIKNNKFTNTKMYIQFDIHKNIIIKF